jgi:hypothetical protein
MPGRDGIRAINRKGLNMPSKQDQYLQFLIDEYRQVGDMIAMYDGKLLSGLWTEEERNAFHHNITKRETLLKSMGVEFPALWERFKKLKARNDNNIKELEDGR